MPQVASETPPASRPLPPTRAGTPRPSQENAGGSSFESLISDSPPRPPPQDPGPAPQIPGRDAAAPQPPAQTQPSAKPQQAKQDGATVKPARKNVKDSGKAASTAANNSQAGASSDAKSGAKADTKATDASKTTDPGQTGGTIKLNPLPTGHGKKTGKSDKSDKDKTAKTNASSKSAEKPATPTAPDPTAAQAAAQQANGQAASNTAAAVVVAATAQAAVSPGHGGGGAGDASPKAKTPVVAAVAGLGKVGDTAANQPIQAGPSAQTPANSAPVPQAVSENPQATPALSNNQKSAEQQFIAAARGEKTTDAHRFALPDASGNASAGAQSTSASSALNAAQNLGVPPPATQPAAQAPTAIPAVPSPVAPVPLAGVAIAIAAHASAGKNSFAIRLDPPELGRVDVRLTVDKDGHITSHLVADRQDTLTLLQRDASGLQRALQDAGFKTADNGLQFSLRDSFAGQQQQQQQQQSNGGTAGHLVLNDETTVAEAIPANYGRYLGRVGGVDIQV